MQAEPEMVGRLGRLDKQAGFFLFIIQYVEQCLFLWS